MAGDDDLTCPHRSPLCGHGAWFPIFDTDDPGSLEYVAAVAGNQLAEAEQELTGVKPGLITHERSRGDVERYGCFRHEAGGQPDALAGGDFGFEAAQLGRISGVDAGVGFLEVAVDTVFAGEVPDRKS